MTDVATPKALPPQAAFLPRIESLRGLAALAVAFCHVGVPLADAAYAQSGFLGGLDALAFRIYVALSNGTGAVVAFFVMSGFVLAKSLDRNPDTVRFLRHRIFRLFPAIVAVIALITLIYRLTGFMPFPATFDAANILLNMLTIHTDINRVMWSMKVEIFATPLILGCAWLFARRGAQPLWIIIAVLFGLSWIGQYASLLGDGTTIAPIYAFVFGMLVHFRGEVFAPLVKSRWATPAAVLSVILFSVCSLLKQTGWTLMIECLSATMLVGLVAHGPHLAVLKPLDLRVVRFYGGISYSFYLLHPLSLWLANEAALRLQAALPGLPVTAAALIAGTLSVALVTPAAWLSWVAIEKPAVRLGRRRPRPAAVDAAPGAPVQAPM
jgi:peptidoglycan/LPS O-acetylase OafA/YrhL